MMTSSRPRDDIAGNRRGHASQLSISDPSHHVTEAIGTLYGDEDDSGSEGGRPLSFVGGSPHNEQLHRTSPPGLHGRPPDYQHASESSTPRPPPDQPPDSSSSHAEHGSLRKIQTFVVPSSSSSSQRSNNSYDHSSKSPVSPTPSLRDVQADSTGSQFPLTNIDNPSDIAQELSNLQALRRLSMDVGNNIDPDMPPMGFSAMPTVAPSGDDDENDPSRLLWVPARVHPELAPTEFKSFLEKRVQSIRRRSGDPLLATDFDASLGRSDSLLRRNKSMLSRQIDNTGGRGAVGYVDGAERLERKRSSSGSQHGPELSLDELVKDPTKAVQRLAKESQSASGGIEGSGDDMPILPMAPGVGLRRSTRTTYRKGGSLRSGDRGSLSRRLAHRQSEGDYSDISSTLPSEGAKGPIAAAAPSEPGSDSHLRSVRPVRRHRNLSQETTSVMTGADGPAEETIESRSSSRAQQDWPPARTTSGSGQEASLTPERSERSDSHATRSFPERSSSQNARPPRDHHPETAEEGSARPTRRPTITNNMKQPAQPQYITKSPNSMHLNTMSDSLASPSSLMGADASRTDNLTFIPTLSQPEKKPEKKSSKRDKDEDSSGTSSRSGSAWKWFKGVTDERDRKKEEGRKSKARASTERTHDNVRLDVIQTSIDKSGVKGRESLVLDRDNVDSKLLEERKKEGNRKSDSKKEKDGSIFSSIFGGSKKKEEKEKVQKKSQHLQVPEDVSYKPLAPDVDYNWSRFPLLEERAIYRMAHIKLANPRRSLLSQVLLSNFMYSYLAIVQTMHPQMNVPTSPQQKRVEEEARRKRREEEYLARHGEHGTEHSLDQYNFDYHRAAVQYADSGTDGQAEYVDEAQIYEDEHGDDRDDDEYGYEGVDSPGREMKEYPHGEDDHRRHRRDDMW
ncbi:hypothetical protein XA68_15454 [Ophiocordyceps unilateralis]|uniref:Protein Zds1 C-terminal domain-containing protein n=1 Tax=Ophiocordyceps unilateralis TaxID=268505 RepID=A0A2A9PKX4_OPHUN|nr:hypothetical protein XA68_15454 [Ophiocordyceps unilateralis]